MDQEIEFWEHHGIGMGADNEKWGKGTEAGGE